MSLFCIQFLKTFVGVRFVFNFSIIKMSLHYLTCLGSVKKTAVTIFVSLYIMFIFFSLAELKTVFFIFDFQMFKYYVLKKWIYPDWGSLGFLDLWFHVSISGTFSAIISLNISSELLFLSSPSETPIICILNHLISSYSSWMLCSHFSHVFLTVFIWIISTDLSSRSHIFFSQAH